MLGRHSDGELSGLQFWSDWWPLEWVPAVAFLLTGAVYMYAVFRLKQRGDTWPIGRSVAFLAGGLGSIFIATQGPLARLDTTLLWTHMVQHMILTMIAPVALALGAPVTLALRTLPMRPRNGLVWLLHSAYARFITFPLVAGAIYIVNPWVLYFTPYYAATLSNPLLHDFNHLHFLIVGCVWFWALIGVDPMPRMGYPLRMLAVFMTLPFHAFLGVTLMGSDTLIAGDYYSSLHREGLSVAADQQLAGGVLWAAGDIVGFILMVVLMLQWARSSQREAERIDRQLDRLEASESEPPAVG